MEHTANTMPAATLGQYKGLAFTRRVRPVSDKAVEADIGNLARVHAPFVPTTDAPAARGMRVTLDFEGFLDGAPIPDSRMEQVTVVLGTGQLMPAAEEAVYGHCAGETFRFDFTYPADFRVPELSGKTAQFEICLHTVERKQVPPRWTMPLHNRWAMRTWKPCGRACGEKKRLSHEANADRIAGAALLDMAGANLTVELPAELLAQNAEYQMTQLRQRLRKSQMTMELYCKSAGLTPEQVREGYRKEAERQLRAMLAVRAIAEAEKITVTQQEVDAEIARLSKLHDTPEEEIRKVLSRDAIAAAVTNQKGAAFPARPRRPYLCCGKGVKTMGFFTRTAMDMLMKTTHPEINRRQCWNLHPHRKPCTTCKDICPYGEEIFTRPNLVKDWDPCTDCGLCVSACRSGCISPSPEQVQRDTSAADTDNDTIWIGCEKSTRKNSMVRTCICALSWEALAYLALNKNDRAGPDPPAGSARTTFAPSSCVRN